MSQCKFQISWVGRCKGEVMADELCSTHIDVSCVVCNQQAVRECDHTGQFVCGAPLCDTCEGFVDQGKPSGGWGFMNHGHRRKEVQP